MKPADTAYNYLIDIEQKSRDCAKELPRQEMHKKNWTGVSFRISSVLCVTPLSEIFEVIRCPKVTEVPGAVKWLIGIMHLRGEIIPVMDVPGFLGYGVIKNYQKARVIVIEHEVGKAGMLINQVMGLSHFQEEKRRPPMSSLKPGFLPFITGTFCTDDTTWNLFSLQKITTNPKFYQISI